MRDAAMEAPAVRMLREAGEKVRQLEYSYRERGGTRDAAVQLGLCEHQIIKSLVFDSGGPLPEEGVMALMHGDERVSLHKLERLAGIRHLEPSAPEQAERLTGYRPGGICPFGLHTPLRVFIQESLLLFDEIYINAGARGFIAAVRPQAILRVPGTICGDFRSPARAADSPSSGGSSGADLRATSQQSACLTPCAEKTYPDT